MNEQAAGGRIGNIELATGVRITHFWTYMYASLICIGMISNMNFSQPYILIEHLGIANPGIAGRITGQLTLITEIMSLMLIWPFGILADRIGRRPVIMLGIGMIGLSYAVYPWATEVNQLMAMRVIFGIGVAAAAAMTATIQNDYPTESSRGRVIGFSSAFNALGIVFATRLVSALPKWLEGRRTRAGGRGPLRLWRRRGCVLRVAAGIPLRPEGRRARNYPAAAALVGPDPLGHRAVEEPAHRARLPVRGYGARPTGRGRPVHGPCGPPPRCGPPGATWPWRNTRCGCRSWWSRLFAVGWSFVFGSILDRISRVAGVVLSMAMAIVAYGSMYFVESPLDLRMLPLFALVGASMAGGMMSSMALVGQEAPPAKRGAVIGLMSLFGSAGIIFAAMVGGELFSAATPWAPFPVDGRRGRPC